MIINIEKFDISICRIIIQYERLNDIEKDG